MMGIPDQFSKLLTSLLFCLLTFCVLSTSLHINNKLILFSEMTIKKKSLSKIKQGMLSKLGQQES